MSITFYEEIEMIVKTGQLPTDYQEMLSCRDTFAREIANHNSNGFQYGVDITAGNIDVGYLLIVGNNPIICVPDENGDYPDNSFLALYCVYGSWN